MKSEEVRCKMQRILILSDIVLCFECKERNGYEYEKSFGVFQRNLCEY